MFSAITLFFLTSTFFLQYTSQKQIRGTPEVDYPTYYVIPKTSFRCSDQLYHGFYADTETRCQVFHYCYEHRQESFLCPMGTIFNQPILACDYWYSSNCSLAPSYYHVNDDGRNKDNFHEADDPIDYQPENLFDKMTHLYEINNKSPEAPVLKNDSDSIENNLLRRDDTKSSGEQFIQNNKTEDYNKYSYDNRFNMVDEKHPEIVKYEVVGLNTVNVHKGSEEEQLYETDNAKDFIFSEDGMLHTTQDVYKMHPTDMNFDQGYSGYGEISNEGNLNHDLYNDFNYKSDFQIPDFDLQKRYSDMNGDYIRRPSRRKPIVIIPEAKPEIVQLSVVKTERKPIRMISTVNEKTGSESSYETTFDFNMNNKDTVSVAYEGFEGTASGEFPFDETNSNLNDYQLSKQKLFYENQEEINNEIGLQQYEEDSSSVISDYSDKEKTRNGYVLSNTDEDEISPNIFGSGRDDLISISNAEYQRTLTDLNYGDESEIFIENAEGSTVIPSDNSEIIITEGNSFDNNPFLGSKSEENIQPLSNDGYAFPDDQDFFSNDEDIEIVDGESTYVLPMNVSDNFEGSGVSAQETAGRTKLAEEANEPIQFVLEDDSEGSIEYGKEKSSFSFETFEKFLPSESSENNDGGKFVSDGSVGSSEFNYLSHELQDFSNNLEDDSYKTVPEIREIDGSYYYVFSDSGHHSNDNYDDSKGIYSENEDYLVPENFEDKASVEFMDNEGSQYTTSGSKLKMDNVGDGSLLTIDYEDSRHLENPYERHSDEFEAETSSQIPEEYIVDDSGRDRPLLTEDLKYLEIMSQTPVPILKNLFEVSNEKSISGILKDEITSIEILSPEQDIYDQEDVHIPASMNEEYEFESFSTETSSENEKHSAEVNDQEVHFPARTTEVYESESFTTETFSNIEKQSIDINDQEDPHEDPASMNEQQEFESLSMDTSSDTAEHSTDVKSSEIFGFEQKITEDVSIIDGSGQDGSEVVLPEQNFVAFVPEKEADPFNPLFAKSDGILLDGSESKQKLSLKIAPVKLKSAVVSPVMGKDLKKVARGKRFNEHLRIFNPQHKGNPLNAPRKETFRETMFTNIPSEFLKMKHSSLSPYFYFHGLKNSGFKPRTGDLFESSKVSKLTALGKRLLAAKRAKFNIMKKYIDSYRNN